MRYSTRDITGSTVTWVSAMEPEVQNIYTYMAILYPKGHTRV